MSHQERINAITKEVNELDEKRRLLLNERESLQLADNKAHYNCPCVVQNKELGIYDMQQQTARKRNPLGMGMVSETLTAAQGCLICGGKGVAP